MTSPGEGQKRPHDDDLLSSTSSKKARLCQDDSAPKERSDRLDQYIAMKMDVQREDNPFDTDEMFSLFDIIIGEYYVLYQNLQHPPAYCVAHHADAARLLKENAFLRPALEEAWKERSFSQITSSIFFQKEYHERISRAIRNQVLATEKAWKSSFNGSYAEVLKDTIVKEKEKANILTVIQSSGAGKSRTVYEVGKSLFSVYINLREEAGKLGTGFPNRDPALCRFIGKAEDWGEMRKRLYCAAFLRGIFTAAASVLGTDKLEPEAFRTRLDDQRSAFDAQAAKQAQVYMNTAVPMANPQDEAQSPYTVLLRGVVTAIDSFASAANLPMYDDVILLTIDECHTLDQAGDSLSTLHVLCSVLRDLRDRTPSTKRLFTVFISTISHPRRPAPAPADDPSKRVMVLKAEELDLYTTFPFDVHTSTILEDTRTLDDVCRLEFLCSFGRPLWMTRYESGSLDVRRNLVSFAQVKLHGSDNLKIPKDDSMFAALSMRHLLTFEPDRRPCGLTEAAYQALCEQEFRQVASHMRVVHSIPSHRLYMRTGTPSEPILAEAAAQLLPEGREQLSFLASKLNPLVSKGERGELAARVLCNLAHDVAVNSLPPPSPDLRAENIQFSRPIPLIAFLEALIHPQFHDVVLDSYPKGGGAPLREAFKDSYVHFTHWAKMGDASCVSTRALWKAAARGIAWQCCDNREGIDQVIPIICDKERQLGRKNVSALVIQDKNVAAPRVTRLKRKLFADAGGDVKPYIFLTMQLGARPTKAAPPPSPLMTTIPTAASPTSTAKLPRKVRASQQYDITITGCSSTVYRVIHPDDRALWTRLLSTKSIEEEHPRGDDPRHLDLLKRSKPFFWEGQASFDWARDSDEDELEEQIDEHWDVVTAGIDDDDEEGG
ncbi:hypothetical protein BDZ89DRAFT_1155434 [Hymenopellis radicata]|nr:hypothetical protein BDZ89DRAFT_1155434 [Hymenopellis radicata]